jgi:hypothetical protein
VQDATAKLSSGILNGNVNQYGDFNLCQNVVAPDEKFQGKYCLAYLQPRIIKNHKYLEYLRYVIQSHDMLKSEFEDVRLL